MASKLEFYGAEPRVGVGGSELVGAPVPALSTELGQPGLQTSIHPGPLEGTLNPLTALFIGKTWKKCGPERGRMPRGYTGPAAIAGLGKRMTSPKILTSRSRPL